MPDNPELAPHVHGLGRMGWPLPSSASVRLTLPEILALKVQNDTVEGILLKQLLDFRVVCPCTLGLLLCKGRGTKVHAMRPNDYIHENIPTRLLLKGFPVGARLQPVQTWPVEILVDLPGCPGGGLAGRFSPVPGKVASQWNPPLGP